MSVLGQVSPNMVTPPNYFDGAGNYWPAGYLYIPQNLQNANYTLQLSDMGKSVDCTTGTPTYTIPANAAVPFPVGAVLGGDSTSTGNVTIAINGGDTLVTPTSLTGSRTVLPNGIWQARKVAPTVWKITGPGVI